MIQNFLAVSVALVCAVLLVRLALPITRRYRFDAWLRRSFLATRRNVVAPYRAWQRRKHAQRVAEEAIRRARGRWDGNVYRPDSFHRDEKD